MLFRCERPSGLFCVFLFGSGCEDKAQSAIFLCEITEFEIIEELAAMCSVRGTMTGSDLFMEEAEMGQNMNTD